MSILATGEIEKYLDPNLGDQGLVLTPILDRKQLGPCSVDVRLGNTFVIPGEVPMSYLDPTSREKTRLQLAKHQREVYIPFHECYILHPKSFVIGSTLEYVKFPKTLAGYVVGRSSWGLLGLMVATAHLVAPGHRGVITLQLTNEGNFPLALYPGMRIAQLVLHRVVGEPSEEPMSRYMGLTRVERSRIYEDEELTFLGRAPRPLMIGLTGPIAAGKNTAGRMIIEETGLTHVRMSLANVVKREAIKQEIEPTRDNLVEVGNNLRSTQEGGPYDIIARMLLHEERGRFDEDILFIVDGIRHPDEARALARVTRFFLVAVETDQDIRWKRVERRKRPYDPDEQKEFERIDKRDLGEDEPEWGQKIADTMALAKEWGQRYGTGFVVNGESEATIREGLVPLMRALRVRATQLGVQLP